MDALISLVYTIIDSVCVCLFLDAFASHRWRDHRFLVGVIVQTILMYASIEFSVIVLNRNQIVKIFLILLSCFIVARTLYGNISERFLLFLIVVEYLLTYSLSFAVGMLATSVCGMDAQTFQANKTLSLIYGISYYSAELFIIALFRKIMLQRTANRPRKYHCGWKITMLTVVGFLTMAIASDLAHFNLLNNYYKKTMKLENSYLNKGDVKSSEKASSQS